MPAEPKNGAASGDARHKAGASKAKSCPICGKPAVEGAKPFCSERCRDVDLNRWLSGSYAIPGRTQTDEDEE